MLLLIEKPVPEPTKQIEIATAYDRWARTYDSVSNKTREMAADALHQAGLQLVSRNVIEIGCGTGLNTEWIAAQAANVVALDFSEGMLRQAQARVRAPNVSFVAQDIRSAWQIDDASADVAIVMLVLEHVEHLDPIFKEAARTLRPDGEFFVCELHPLRQMSGGQAQFTDTDTGERVHVPAFLHDVSEFVNGGLRAGFELVHLGELQDEDALASDPFRLLTVRLRLRD